MELGLVKAVGVSNYSGNFLNFTIFHIATLLVIFRSMLHLVLLLFFKPFL